MKLDYIQPQLEVIEIAPLQLLDGSPIVTGIDSEEFVFAEDGLDEPGR